MMIQVSLRRYRSRPAVSSSSGPQAAFALSLSLLAALLAGCELGQRPAGANSVDGGGSDARGSIKFDLPGGAEEDAWTFTCSQPSDREFPCYADPQPLGGAEFLCRRGTQRCLGGEWTACSADVGEEYTVRMPAPSGVPQPLRIDPPRACNLCDPLCRESLDEPEQIDLTPTNHIDVLYDPGQSGITLEPNSGGVLSDRDGDGIPTELDPSAPPCVTNADCGATYSCVMGFCRRWDADDNDASVGFRDATALFAVVPACGSKVTRKPTIEIQLRTVDIYFLVENTGTMRGERDNLVASINTLIIPGISTLIPDAWFGLGGIGDYPFGGASPSAAFTHGAPTDLPFYHWTDIGDATNNAVFRAELSADLAAIPAEPSTGGDDAEASLSAMWAASTGSAINSGAWSYVGARAGCAAGRLGYPCFRAGSTPVFVVFSDSPMHNGPSGLGADAPEQFYNAPLVAPSYASTVTALNAIGAKVVTIWSGGGRNCGDWGCKTSVATLYPVQDRFPDCPKTTCDMPASPCPTGSTTCSQHQYGYRNGNCMCNTYQRTCPVNCTCPQNRCVQMQCATSVATSCDRARPSCTCNRYVTEYQCRRRLETNVTLAECNAYGGPNSSNASGSCTQRNGTRWHYLSNPAGPGSGITAGIDGSQTLAVCGGSTWRCCNGTAPPAAFAATCAANNGCCSSPNPAYDRRAAATQWVAGASAAAACTGIWEPNAGNPSRNVYSGATEACAFGDFRLSLGPAQGTCVSLVSPREPHTCGSALPAGTTDARTLSTGLSWSNCSTLADPTCATNGTTALRGVGCVAGGTRQRSPLAITNCGMNPPAACTQAGGCRMPNSGSNVACTYAQSLTTGGTCTNNTSGTGWSTTCAGGFWSWNPVACNAYDAPSTPAQIAAPTNGTRMAPMSCMPTTGSFAGWYAAPNTTCTENGGTACYNYNTAYPGIFMVVRDTPIAAPGGVLTAPTAAYPSYTCNTTYAATCIVNRDCDTVPGNTMPERQMCTRWLPVPDNGSAPPEPACQNAFFPPTSPSNFGWPQPLSPPTTPRCRGNYAGTDPAYITPPGTTDTMPRHCASGATGQSLNSSLCDSGDIALPLPYTVAPGPRMQNYRAHAPRTESLNTPSFAIAAVKETPVPAAGTGFWNNYNASLDMRGRARWCAERHSTADPANCMAWTYSGGIEQWRKLATDTDSLDGTQVPPAPVVEVIQPDGSGLGPAVVQAIANVANYIRQDISLNPIDVAGTAAVDERGFLFERTRGDGRPLYRLKPDPYTSAELDVLCGVGIRGPSCAFDVDARCGEASRGIPVTTGDNDAGPRPCRANSFCACLPGTRVRFAVEFQNKNQTTGTPLVAEGPAPQEFPFTIQVLSNGVQVLQTLNAFAVVPEMGATFPNEGYYVNDYHGNAQCNDTEVPVWEEIEYSVGGQDDCSGRTSQASCVGNTNCQWDAMAGTCGSCGAEDTGDVEVRFELQLARSQAALGTAPVASFNAFTTTSPAQLQALLMSSGYSGIEPWMRVRAVLVSSPMRRRSPILHEFRVRWRCRADL